MTDYPELHQRLAQAIIKAEGKLGGDTQAFVQRFIKQLNTEGYQVKGEAEAELTRYLDSLSGALTTAIKQAVVIGSAVPMTAASLQSKAVLAAAEQVFSHTWEDGANLSKRLWQFQQDSKTGLAELLQTGIKQGQASNKVVYDMQRLIERAGGERFAVVSNNRTQWVSRLAAAGKGLINSPQDRARWLAVVADTEIIIDKLAATSTRTDAERLLTDIQAAVNRGNRAAIDRAVEWKLYHKQLYNLKRLVRTEMATAMHNAVIDSTHEDSTVIGYQWRLSGSHKVFDICNYYANIDMGLGRGVWTKEAVPRHKAHPHCLLGDTLITNHGAIVAATKSVYQGRVIEIITRNSRKLTCTANHAILAREGWIEAQFLNKGQQIVTTTNSNACSLDPKTFERASKFQDLKILRTH